MHVHVHVHLHVHGHVHELILTGHLGAVMQESVRTALSWIRSRAREIGIDAHAAPDPISERGQEMAACPPPDDGGLADADADADATVAMGHGVVACGLPRPSQPLLAGIDVHVHFPAGAIRKDGPSAGVTVLVALVSLFTGRVARSDTAMSGEISLRGNVLPVGGVREKVLAAHRAGVKRVLLPHQNRKDVNDLDDKVTAELAFVWCETVEQVLAEALVPTKLSGRASAREVGSPVALGSLGSMGPSSLLEALTLRPTGGLPSKL